MTEASEQAPNESSRAAPGRSRVSRSDRARDPGPSSASRQTRRAPYARARRGVVFPSLVCVLLASFGCRTFSPAPEIKDFDAAVRQTHVALGLLSESVEIERQNRYRRDFLLNPGPFSPNNPETISDFRDRDCLVLGGAGSDAGAADSIDFETRLREIERDCEGDGRTTCAAPATTRDFERYQPLVGKERIDAWNCALVASSTRREGEDTVADEPLVGGSERHALSEILAQSADTSRRIARYSKALRSVATHEDVRSLNAAMRRATVPLKVGLVTSQTDPSAEISNIDGARGLLMQLFDSVHQLVRNAGLRKLVAAAQDTVGPAGAALAERVQLARAMLESRLGERLNEADADLDRIRTETCTPADFDAEGLLVSPRRCSAEYFERVERAYREFDDLRTALLAVRKARIERLFSEYAAMMADLRIITSYLNGPSPILHGKAYREHIAAIGRLDQRRQQADEMLEALAQAHAVLQRLPSHRVIEEE